MPKFNRDDIDKLYDYDIFMPTRTIYVGSNSVYEEGESGVNAELAERVIKALLILDQKEEPITIILNNPGGDFYHGMAIYDAIKACKSHITIKVYGMAMSMAAVILQAADKRVMMPNARFMIHYGESGFMGHAKTFDKWADEYKKLNSKMEQILLEKIKVKRPTFTIKELQKLLNHDTIYSALETINMGLADEVYE
jgi:ATP-dependent Clp endopeptidase proteolytic subunit ClpP